MKNYQQFKNNKRLSMIRFKLISLTLIMGSILFSQEILAIEKFPFGCRPVGFSFKYHVLMLSPQSDGGSQSLYLVHNKSPKLVQLYQMRTSEEPYNIHINNEIRSNQWSALATDEKLSKFICTIPKRDSRYGEITDCGSLLELCEYTNVKFSINNHGNYWAVESEPLNEVIRQVIDQGILLRW
jgi:hypothetical protein